MHAVPLNRPTIVSLRDLIHGVPLPKSRTAKSCSVPIDTCKQISTAVSLLAANANHDITQTLSSLATQIDSLQQNILKINQSTVVPQSPKPTSSSPATPLTDSRHLGPPPALLSSPQPHAIRFTSCDLVLSPVDRKKPAFTSSSCGDIQRQFNEVIPRLVSSSRNPVQARAVAKRRNGDICITLPDSDHPKLLRDAAQSWLPAFSNLLSLRQQTFPVIVHRVPTTHDFDGFTPFPLDDDDADSKAPTGSSGMDTLIAENCSRLYDLRFDVERVHWISRTSRSKPFSSLVLHFRDKESADHCIYEKIALNGCLLRTEKYQPRPAQCFNCFRFGHLARDCKSASICGRCAGPHSTSNCHCPKKSPCTNLKKCSHIVSQCAIRSCGGAHWATSTDCPFRQAVIHRASVEHSLSGVYFDKQPDLD